MVRMYTFRDEESVELKQGMAKNSNMFLNIDTLQIIACFYLKTIVEV